MDYKIFSSQKLISSGHASSITLPTAEGEVTVMDDHEDFLFTVASGQITVTFKENTNYHSTFDTQDKGIVEILDGKCTVLL